MGRLVLALWGLVLVGCQSAPPGPVGEVLALSAAVADRGETVVAVTLKDCPPGSRCELVRYWNDQFQDFQTVKVKKRGVGTEFVRWTPGPGGKGQRPGTYRVKVFLNGRFARQVDYTVG